MNVLEISGKLLFCLLVLAAVSLFFPQTAFSQAEKLGIVQYTPPLGMAKTVRENIVAFNELNQTAGTYCIITLYGATPGTGTPEGDFKREWANLVVRNMQAEANPQTDSGTDGGWTIVTGGAKVNSDVGEGVAFLSVISGFGRTVSILAVFNDPVYVKKLDDFISAIDLDQPAPAVNNTAAVNPPTLDSDGNLFVPEPTRQLTLIDLAGVWGDNPGRISTTYVNRSDGSYAGTDSLHFTSKWTIGSDGRATNDFFEVRNGQKLSDVTTGVFTIAGRLISIRQGRSTAKYVVRGWLELPTMTILKIAGPWYDDQEIPERIFTDFSEDSRFILTSKWVRMK